MNNRASAATNPMVSIIIPVFNKCDLTVQCLEAIQEVTARVAHEIIIVDNASSDGTPQRLAALKLPNLRVIRNETNRGFAGACNQGAAAATGKYLLFLNNDTVPVQGWLEALVEELRTHPNVAAVGSKLVYESTLVQHAGVAFGRETRSPFHPHRLLRMDDPRVNIRREMQAVTAACMMIRPKWFQDCGGFKEDYRNGYEDLDLCLEIRKRGGVIVYQPKSQVIHFESQTPGRMKFDNENRALFFQRWNDAILADEDAYYFEGGLHSLGRTNCRIEEPRLARFNSEAERRQWSVVAECQRAAAAQQMEVVKQKLSDVNVWPADAAVRRWAGALCLHLELPEVARRHFDVALELADSPELRAQLDVSPTGKTSPAKWEAMARAGLHALRNGDFVAAQTALETALLRGAPPSLILPGWQQAADATGSADAAATRHALLALPRVDKFTAEKLKATKPGIFSLSPSFSPVTANGEQPETVSTDSQAQKAAEAAASSKTFTSTGLKPGANENDDSRQPLASIIVLALNQLDHTRKCVDSLLAHTRAPFEVILVDNGSTDGTAEYFAQLRQQHSNFKIITNRTNRGFAGGNNQALAIAQGELLVLLNNDTVVTPGWLEGFSAVLNAGPAVGLAGPVSNHVSGPQQIPVSYSPHASHEQIATFAKTWSAQNAGQTQAVNRLVGFCLAFRRSVFDAVGGLDENFGSGNFEDDDFCIRARLAGFTSRIARSVFIHHTGSQTFKGAKIDYRSAMLRNWDLFRAKWRFPAEVTLERGYPTPKQLPDGVPLKLALPLLNLTHKANGENDWSETVAAKPAVKAKPEIPSVARLGNLDEARAQFGRREFQSAWTATFAALQTRPFHPEAWLLLAEIALAVGDSVSARQCAQRARDLAPGWKAPKQFLQKSTRGNAKHDWLNLPAQPGTRNPELGTHLTICVIAKNEGQFLDQCLKSVKGIAHQLVVVDTGSTDRTVEIAKSHGAEVHHFEWRDDFSAARNAALEHITGDWILMLDADEELPADQHARLRADMKKAEAIAYRMPLVNRGEETQGASFVPRLYRNAPGAYYYGRIHEQVFPSLIAISKSWGMDTRLGTAQLLHHGYTKELVRDRNKIERNLNLLRLAIAERPDDPNLTMNLGLELVRSGDLDGGIVHYRDAFRLMSAQAPADVVPELREVLLTQFTSHLYKIRAHDTVVQILNSPLAKRGGLTASLHFALGLAQFELKQHREAAEQMRQCISKRKQPAFAPINTDILTAAPHHCLALSLVKLGDAAGAEETFRAGLAENGRTNELKLDYAKHLASQTRHVDALTLLNEIVQHNPQNAAAWRLGGEIALSKPEFLEFAGDWTGEAVRVLPGDVVLVAQRAEALLLSQQTQPALPLWERTCNCERPARALAAQILCATVESQPARSPQNNVEEIATSRAFLDWYKRLIAAGAQDTIMRLNARVDTLRSTLPSAACLLETVVAEAGKSEAVEAAAL